MVRLRISRISFAAKHSWTTCMNRSLSVGSYLRARGGISANEKDEKFASNDNANYASLFAGEETSC